MVCGILLFLIFFLFQMLLQNKIDVLRQRTVVILCFLFYFLQNITVDRNANFLLQRFHCSLTSADIIALNKMKY